MAKALYRTYRSKTLNEIVGQKAVTTALSRALKSGQLSHAYLFTGPRGVGKTSVARILAHEINNLPYTSDELPLDIIEIDAASNRRIDEIRDLRERVQIAPVSAKYKVYIIDEVHMLTREAFNALLKTLEEPPAHVVFILATTEAHKLPETIVSRTQRYSFKLASTEEVAAHLNDIAKKESLTITDEALTLIAQHSGGSLRDALSLLDQVRHGGDKIDETIVRQSLGLPTGDITQNVLTAVAGNEPGEVISALKDAYSDGVSAGLLAEQLQQALRASLITKKPVLPANDTLHLLQELILVEASPRPEIQLEIALIGAQLAHAGATKVTTSSAHISTPNPPLTISEPAVRPKKADTKAKPSTPEKHQIKHDKSESPAPRPETDNAKTVAAEPTITDSAATSGELTSETWAIALDTIRRSHNTIYSVLRMAEPDFSNASNKHLTLKFGFPFHQKRMNEAKNKQVLITTLSSLGITGYEITCDALPRPPKQETTEVTLEPFEFNADEQIRSDVVVDHIRSVFGGAEVLE